MCKVFLYCKFVSFFFKFVYAPYESKYQQHYTYRNTNTHNLVYHTITHIILMLTLFYQYQRIIGFHNKNPYFTYVNLQSFHVKKIWSENGDSFHSPRFLTLLERAHLVFLCDSMIFKILGQENNFIHVKSWKRKGWYGAFQIK